MLAARALSRTARRARLVQDGRHLSGAGGAAASPPPEALVRGGIRPESLPRHVALVTDGNWRWAQARGLLTADGHEAGRRALEHAIWLSHAWGIRALTVFAFSQENFGRPKTEVDYVLGMIERTIRENVVEYERKGIRLHVIGDPSRRPESLQEAAREAEEMTGVSAGGCPGGRGNDEEQLQDAPDAGDLLQRAMGDRAGVPGAGPESAGRPPPAGGHRRRAARRRAPDERRRRGALLPGPRHQDERASSG